MCGWLKDKYGVAWQIVPHALVDMLRDKDRTRSRRVMEAVMQMIKIEIGELQRAFDGA